MRGITYGILLVLLMLFLTCKKTFKPTLTTITTNFLAVDGPIISGDSTFISLSRTTSLSDTTQNKAELKATVSVEDDQAKLYTLKETGKGKYVLGVINFDAARKYRLDIKTADGKIYQSDFVPMKVTPPIDSIYFKQNGDQNITFCVNTHDANNSTRYYRWDYKETYSVVPFYQARYQYKNSQIVPIVPGSTDDISVCYQSDFSNQIFVGSSAKLAKDIITEQAIGSLAAGSEKIAHIYCIQLRQYGLTEDGFNYYQNLKSNTEQIGTIFDAQPSTLNGNIHCITSPTDHVFGFISASTVTNKQYNLRYANIPLNAPNFYKSTYFENLNLTYGGYPISDGYFPPPTVYDCAFLNITAFKTWSLPVSPIATFNLRASRTLAKGDSLAVDAILTPDPQTGLITITGYIYAPKQCVDCRIRGGTNIRPAYFPAY